jgi:hypothetical protein
MPRFDALYFRILQRSHRSHPRDTAVAMSRRDFPKPSACLHGVVALGVPLLSFEAGCFIAFLKQSMSPDARPSISIIQKHALLGLLRSPHSRSVLSSVSFQYCSGSTQKPITASKKNLILFGPNTSCILSRCLSIIVFWLLSNEERFVRKGTVPEDSVSWRH